jgi:ribosome-binding factor A
VRSTPRTRRLAETIREALAEILSTEVQDPRLELATVTSVEVSADLHVANVYVTAHGGPERYDALLEGLHSADRRIRSALAQRVTMRIVPELRYYVDRSVDESMRISEALKERPPHVPEDDG